MNKIILKAVDILLLSIIVLYFGSACVATWNFELNCNT